MRTRNNKEGADNDGKKAQITVPIHIEPGNRQHQGRGREAGCHGYGYLSCGLDGWDICSKLRDVCKGTGDDPAGYGPGRPQINRLPYDGHESAQLHREGSTGRG